MVQRLSEKRFQAVSGRGVPVSGDPEGSKRQTLRQSTRRRAPSRYVCELSFGTLGNTANLETLGLKRRHKTRAATAGQPGPQPGNSASNRTSKQSYRLHLRLMPSTWGRGELSPFLRSLRWRSLHRHVPACRFLILSGLEATITSYQHVLGSTNLRRGRRYCRNPHHECSCSCSRVPHATCPLHMSLHVSHRADGDEWLQQPVHGGKAAR